MTMTNKFSRIIRCKNALYNLKKVPNRTDPLTLSFFTVGNTEVTKQLQPFNLV